MTWLELKDFINKIDGPTLYSSVKLYDFSTGEEYEVGITELLISEDQEENSGWVPYLSINEESLENGETKETSIN
jgi:hypothetical protein